MTRKKEPFVPSKQSRVLDISHPDGANTGLGAQPPPSLTLFNSLREREERRKLLSSLISLPDTEILANQGSSEIFQGERGRGMSKALPQTSFLRHQCADYYCINGFAPHCLISAQNRWGDPAHALRVPLFPLTHIHSLSLSLPTLPSLSFYILLNPY